MLKVDSDRYDRMRRISWVDMDSIAGTRCLVVGAGALGNEVVKNLVMAGFRDITVVDMDYIILSNLSRCIFFRDSDIRSVSKAQILAERASELDPDCRMRAEVGYIQDYREKDYDIAFGCLDNISARLHVNAHSYHDGKPYIDGATEGLRGKVQVVLPGGPCLECLMNRTHAQIMEQRYTCSGNLAYVPKVPSEITTTSVIGAIQVREAMKIASGREDICIRNVCYYDGITGETEILEIQTREDCPNHGARV